MTLIGVVLALAVLTMDRGEGGRQFLDIGRGTGMQGGLNGRLIGARLPAKGLLQGGIAVQSGIGLHQAVRSGPSAGSCNWATSYDCSGTPSDHDH